MSLLSGLMAPIVINNFAFKLLSFQIVFKCSNHNRSTRERERESEIYVCLMAEQFDPTLQTLMHSIMFWSQTYCFAFITAICFDSFQLLVPNRTGRREVIEIGHPCHYLKLNAIKPPVLCSYYQNYYNLVHS